MVVDDLTQDSRNIAHDNGEDKDDAFPLRRFCFYALVHGYGPRDPKTSQHNQFENFHKTSPLHFSISTIIHLTNEKVKYIIIIKLISFRYQFGADYGNTKTEIFLYGSKITTRNASGGRDSFCATRFDAGDALAGRGVWSETFHQKRKEYHFDGNGRIP